MVRGTNRETVGTGTAGRGTGGPSLPTPTTRTCSLAAFKVTQTAGQVLHQLITTLTAPVA